MNIFTRSISVLVLCIVQIVLYYLIMVKGWGLEVNDWYWFIGCATLTPFVAVLIEYLKTKSPYR